MHETETILGLLLYVGAVAWAATRLRISYPILLVVGGLALSFIPGLPHVALRHDLVFILFLPPLLYYAALRTSWRDFKANLRPISLLAIGLVLFTTCAVAAVAHWMVPGLPWAAAFVLGAIVSPPDAVAATAVTQRLPVPKRIISILEGESLVNDASALVAYRVAVAAVVTGTFSLPQATLQFVVAAAGGIVVGLGAGMLLSWVRPRIRDDSVETVFSLLTPYLAYLPAEWLGYSSVLSVVTCGLYIARRLDQITTARMRIRAFATWETLIFLLNGLVFILIGLQLSRIVHSRGGESVLRAAGYAVVVSIVAIAVRMLWVFPATYLPRMLFRKVRENDPAPPWRNTFVIAWTGMRGVVSLAAALALPLTLKDGATPFPRRDMIIFITFGVILATLVLQGLTLPVVIRWLRVAETTDPRDDEETMARYLAALAAVERLDSLAPAASARGPDGRERLARVRAAYDERVAYFSRRLGNDGAAGAAATAPDATALACETTESMEREAITAERQMVIRLRDQGVIGDEVMRRIQSELDHEESRLDSEQYNPAMPDAAHWMSEAIALARAAMALGEVPIGCVIVHDPTGRVVGRGHNRRETDRDPTAHAEILAMREAGAALGHWRLVDCTLVVTLEPCPMCAGAIVNARVPRLVYGCDDPKAGAVRTLYQVCTDDRLNHRVEVTPGVLADECAELLREFFRRQRALGKK